MLMARPTLLCTNKSKHVQHLWMMTSLHINLYLGCLGANFLTWVCKSWPFWLGLYCWTISIVAKLTWTITTTKHYTQQPTWAAATLPSRSFALSLQFEGSGALKSWHPNSPWVHIMRLVAGLRSLRLVPLFGAPKRNPLRKRERGRAQALGGRRSIIWHSDQPKDRVGDGTNQKTVLVVGRWFEKRRNRGRTCRWQCLPIIEAIKLNNRK